MFNLLFKPNDSNSDADRAYLQDEVAQLAEEITRISHRQQVQQQIGGPEG